MVMMVIPFAETCAALSVAKPLLQIPILRLILHLPQMSVFLFIFTALVVLTGSALGLIAPIWKEREKRFRIVAAFLTVTGGCIGILFGLRSAAKTDALMRSTTQISETSGKTLSAVDETLKTSKGVLEETRKNLDTTNESLEIASRAFVNSKEASSYISGGNQYPWVIAYPVTREDGTPQIGFALQKNGKYPLYDLKVFVGKPYKASESVVTYPTGGVSREFPELNGNIGIPLWFQPIPEENSTFYWVIMSARNGNWEEVINIQKVSSGVATRWVLFGSRDRSISPNKQIFDLADRDFPVAERKRKIYPLTELALP
jgi:hypothetical protein